MQTKSINCAFCGQILTNKTKSKEHVFPRWLQHRLELEKQQIQGVHYETPWGFPVKSTRQHSITSLVLGGVCATCNNGWMSNLEKNVVPIFEYLWSTDSDKYIVLDFAACATLATWAYKTSIVINLASNYRKIVPSEHYREFYENKKLPINTAVDISLAPLGKNLSWVQAQSAMGIISGELEITKEEVVKITSSLYVITLDVSGVLLRTCWVPSNFLEVMLPDKADEKRIYPYIRPAKLSLIKRKNELYNFHYSARYRSKKDFVK